MRPRSLLGFFALVLCTSGLIFAAPAKPGKVMAKFHAADVDTGTTSSIQIFYDDLTPGDTQAIQNAVKPSDSWSILVDGKLSPIRVTTASIPHSGGIINLQLSGPLGADTVSKHHITILFAGDPATHVQPESVDVKQPKSAPSSGWFPPKFNFTTDKKNPNLDVSGSLQTGVAAKPQYQWNVLAQAPWEHDGLNWDFTAGPKFTGIASQETNADPDSLSASAATEFYFFRHSLAPNILFNPISYEFERKAKQEAVLVNGKPTVHNYQQKNTNLIVSAGLQFVTGFGHGKKAHTGFPVGLNINLGTEIGSAVSRSVLNQNPKPGYSDNPLRAVAGSDVYFDVYRPAGWKYPLLNVDGHYTVRLPFHPEPFQEAGVNNGNQFYSTQARHYITASLSHTIVAGSNFTVKYLYGSLPPTYSFVDHQVTIGFEVVLGK